MENINNVFAATNIGDNNLCKFCFGYSKHTAANGCCDNCDAEFKAELAAAKASEDGR